MQCLLPRTYANTNFVICTAAVLLIVNCNQSQSEHVYPPRRKGISRVGIFTNTM